MALSLRILVVLALGLSVVFATPLNSYAQDGRRQTRQLDALLQLHGERPEAYDFQLPRQYYYFNRGAGFPASAFSNSGPAFSNTASSFSRFPSSQFGSSGVTSSGSFARPDPHYATNDRLTVRDRQVNSLIGVIPI